MNPMDSKFYKEAGHHHPDTKDINDCFMLNSSGTAKITCIKVWVQSDVFGLEVFYNGNTNGPKIGKYMPPNVTPSQLDLQPGEDIKEINGYHGNILQSLIFVTTMGRSINFGNNTKDQYFSLSMPNRVVSKIKFGVNGHVHYIGAVFSEVYPNNMMGQFQNQPMGGMQQIPNVPFGNQPQPFQQPHSHGHHTQPNTGQQQYPNPNVNYQGGQGGYPNQPYGNMNQGSPPFPNQPFSNQPQYPQGPNQGSPNQGYNQGGMMNPNYSQPFPGNVNPMGFFGHNISTVFPTNKVGTIPGDCKVFDDYNTVIKGMIQQNKKIVIDEVEILFDNLYVVGFKVEFKAKDSSGNEVELKQKHVGTNKTPATKEEHYKFSPGEYVTEIYGRAGAIIDQLYLRTSSGKCIGGGGNGGNSFSIKILPGQSILGFGGAVGGYLAQIFAYAGN